MNISKVDKNFADSAVSSGEVEWIEIPSDKVTLCGVFYDEKDGLFRRVPKSVVGRLSDNVRYLSTHTTGGRIIFETDSPFIALKGVENNVGFMSNMALFGVYGFSVSANGTYRGTVMPDTLSQNSDLPLCPNRIDSPISADDVAFEGSKPTGVDGIALCKVGFPLYTGVRKLFLGVKKGSIVQKANPYSKKPIVFYGSSITHGACASRAGLDYASLVSEMMNIDFLNVAFAGNCHGEMEMAQYIAGIDSSLYVIEYDHNAKTVDMLQNTHCKFYEALRRNNKTTPILFFSRPGPEYFADWKERREVVKNTVERGRKSGDENVYFIGGETFFGKDYSLCTADTCHPNDIGFCKMASSICDFIKKNKIIK